MRGTDADGSDTLRECLLQLVAWCVYQWRGSEAGGRGLAGSRLGRSPATRFLGGWDLLGLDHPWRLWRDRDGVTLSGIICKKGQSVWLLSVFGSGCSTVERSEEGFGMGGYVR